MLHMLAISADQLNPVFAGEFLRILSEADIAYYYRKGVVERRVVDGTVA